LLGGLALIYEVLVILGLILLNGFLSMSEMAIVSAKKNRLQSKADKGSKKAETALMLAENPNHFFSTVQIGITMIGILSGAFGGATIAEKIANEIAKIPGFEPYSQGIGVGLIVILITYLSLVVGELVPKRIALNSAEKVSLAVAGVMNFFSKITKPFVFLLSKSTNLVLSMLGIKLSSEPAVTEEDLKNMLFVGKEIGVIEASEQTMVERIFRLSDRDVSAVMTPRTEIVFLEMDDSQEEIIRKISESPYTRFPVVSETYDDVIGIVNSKDLLLQLSVKGKMSLDEVMQEPFFLPETTPALETVEILKKSGFEIALIIDEYGGLLGLVGMGDILQSIIGNVAKPLENIDEEVVLRDDGSWLFDGMVQIDELKEYLGIDRLPEEEEGRYETLGGFMMAVLNRIPLTGDYFDWNGFRFEVMDMDGRRVDRVMVIPEKNDPIT
jgi:putative hemolysin